VGEAHDPETHLILWFSAPPRDANQPVTVFGTDYATPDGTCVRDYIHVTDLAAAHELALGLDVEPGKLNCFNLGTGEGMSVRQIIESAEKITGRPVAVKYGPRRPGDPATLVASAEKARTTLGWTPRHSDIDTIIGTAWNWMMR